ncbi:hypothetical protein AC1031_015759 [Aphanomyces cochlioides]|nr:hypothetical protein AC1031_015759 [Aphanomyces cochlioides]
MDTARVNPDGVRYMSVSEQLLDMSMNKQLPGKLDRHALEKRLMELQGDVSRLVTKLSTRAKDETSAAIAHESSVVKLSQRAKSSISVRQVQEKKPPAAALNTTKTSIPGSRMGNLIRLQSELHATRLSNDKLRFDLDQMRRTMEAQQAKLREFQELQAAYRLLQEHCASLQQSLDLSETIRQRQKKMLHDLKLSKSTSSLGVPELPSPPNDNQLDEKIGVQEHWMTPPPAPAQTRKTTAARTRPKPKKTKLQRAASANSSFLAPTQASQQRFAETRQFLRQQQLDHRR